MSPPPSHPLTLPPLCPLADLVGEKVRRVLPGAHAFSLDVTTNGRDWWIKIKVQRRLWRWQIWTWRRRRSASRYWPMFLGSSRRAPQAPLKMPPAEIPPRTRGRAAAKGSHGVTVVPRRHRRLHLPRRHRRLPTTTTTAWGARGSPESWRSSSAGTMALRASWTTDQGFSEYKFWAVIRYGYTPILRI